MSTIASGLIFLIAIEHLWFLVLEMFLWTKPLGLKTFAQSLKQARESATLAANQGLYNGFLAAGLLWSNFAPQPVLAHQLRVFFLCCVVVAGIYGGWSVRFRIALVQALPAAVALLLVLASSN